MTLNDPVIAAEYQRQLAEQAQEERQRTGEGGVRIHAGPSPSYNCPRCGDRYVTDLRKTCRRCLADRENHSGLGEQAG